MNEKKENDIKMFTVGPSQMYQHTLDVKKKVVPYFRTTEFSEIMLDNDRMIKHLTGAAEDSHAIFLTASGSGAMEATVINCFGQEDRLLIISGGTFGERFEKICDIHNIPYEPIKLGPDEQLESKHLLPYEGKSFTGLLVNLHETYTGQLYNITLIKEFCQRNNLYLIVDAISTFLCEPYHMTDNNIDATIISSQKGLCLSPGLAIIILSKRIVDNKVLTRATQSIYFDFKDYIDNMERGQTPFTPCVGTLYELHDMLNYISRNGLDNRLNEVRDRAVYFRSKISDLPIHLPPFPLSNAITPIRFEKDTANEFFEYLKNEKNIMVNPVGGALGKSSIRVAHIGDLSFNDYDDLIEEMKIFFNM